MNNLSHLQQYNDSIYARKCAKYDNLQKLYGEKLDFDNFAFNAHIRYLETGDVTHVNRVLNAAKHVNRFREFRSLFRKLTAHTWNPGQNGILDNTSKASRKKMKQLRAAGPDGFLMEFHGEENSPKKSVAKNWDLEKKLASFIKQAEKNGYGLADIQNAFLSSRRSVDVEERKAA